MSGTAGRFRAVGDASIEGLGDETFFLVQRRIHA
jgi:hypothetical protein